MHSSSCGRGRGRGGCGRGRWRVDIPLGSRCTSLTGSTVQNPAGQPMQSSRPQTLLEKTSFWFASSCNFQPWALS